MKNRNVLLIQLTRIGDIFQTIQSCETLRDEHPDVDLDIVVYRQYANFLLPYLEKLFTNVYTVDTKDIFSGINKDGIRNFYRNNYSKNSFLNKSYSVAINLSFSKTSEYLTSIIKTEHKVGVHRNKDHQLTMKDQWSQYVYSNVLETNLNSFNLVDIFRNIVGLSNNNYHARVPNRIGNEITLHPFSSHEKKRWSAHKWSDALAAIFRALPAETIINIVGAPSEKEQADNIIASNSLKPYLKQINNLVGQTKDATEIAQVLERSRMFIGHDSMVGHLASIHNIQTLTISLGTVRPFETTPYGNLNYNLAPTVSCFPCRPKTDCDFFQCHYNIHSNLVAECVSQIYQEGTIDTKNLDRPELSTNNTQIYVSHVDEKLGQQITPMTAQSDNVNDIYRTSYHILFQFLLNEFEIVKDFPKLTDNTIKILRHHVGTIHNLYELAEFGKKYALYTLQDIANDRPEEKKKNAHRLIEVQNLLNEIVITNPFLSPIVNFYYVKLCNVDAEDEVTLYQSLLLVYDQLTTATTALYELINSIGRFNGVNDNVNNVDN